MDEDKYLQGCISIEPLALQEEYVRISSDLAFWNDRYANALAEERRAKLHLEELSAMLYIKYREDRTGRGEKPTEAMLKADVTTDTQMHSAEVTLLDAEVARERLRGRLEAIRTKREMLVSLGAHVREEMKGDPSIRRMQRDYNERT